MPPPAGDSVLAQQLGERGFGILVATAADAGHDGGAFGFGENVRHFSNFTSTDCFRVTVKADALKRRKIGVCPFPED